MISLLNHNTFGIEQGCKELFEPKTEEELTALLPQLREEPLLIIGGGSNLLLTKDFDGNVLHPCIMGREIIDDSANSTTALLRCGAGENWDETVAFAIDNGLYDMENLSLIPGEVGASAVQNIGAYGMEAKDIIYKVEAIEIATGKKVIIDPADCQYAYRYSRFKGEWKNHFIITYVTYKISHTFTPRLDYGNLRSVLADRVIDTTSEEGMKKLSAKAVRDAVIAIRNAKLPDPKVEGNAGSFFMNPVVSREKYQELQKQYPNMPHYTVAGGEKIPAGWMIDQCGWKGKALGRAGVHSKQALVLVNKGGATGAEVVTLCETIRHDVAERFGIDIHPEVNII